MSALQRYVAAGITVSVLIATVSVTAPATAATGVDPPVVRTENGLVRGTISDHVRVFEGIPYAAPPVGALRWRSPQRPSTWRGVRDATKPGAACAQGGNLFGDPPSEAEDCLTLNVTTPKHVRPKRKLPVMVWIHGGGHQWGSGAIYGAERLVRRGDVVVVTLNYRLNVFGFLAHPALDELANHGSGNLGLEDQQAALRWVRRNARAFGGDPRNVTIFGQSAGALATCAHLTAPGSRGLFDRVIMQSGPCTMNWPYGQTPRAKPRAEAEAIGLAVAQKAGCADPDTALSCLRAKSAKELLAADNSEHGHGPSFGGNGVVPDDPAELIARGQFARVPVLHGTMRDEHVTFQAAMDLYAGGQVPPEQYGPTLSELLGVDDEQAARVVATYPLSAYAGSTSAATAAVLTDWAWVCPAVELNGLLARRTRTYAFEFADRTAPWFATPAPPDYPTGAFHTAELQYLFSGAYAGTPLSPPQVRLSDQLIAYWTSFASDGDPNGRRSPPWPRARASSTNVLALAPGPRGIRQVDLFAEHHCGFWDSFS